MSKNTSYDYFNYFEEMIDHCLRSIQLLQTILKNYDYTKLAEYKEQMHAIEHSADLKKHEMMSNLIKEFLPPIERDDIIRISHMQDEICDSLEEVVLLMYMGDIRYCRPDTLQITEVILLQCQEMKQLFSKFRNFKKDKSLEECIVMVNTIEEDGDRLYVEAMRRLNTDGSELKDIIHWRDVYRCLEDCCDCCEKVVDAVEEVLMKN